MAIPRTSRFSSLLPDTIWPSQHILVIGVGAIGRSLSLLLSQLPLGSLTLIDPDEVSEENLGPQGFYPSQIDQLKVDCCASDCQDRNPALPVHTFSRFAYPSDLSAIEVDINEAMHTIQPTFVFLCVDSMDARKELAADCPCPLIDCRMGAQTANLIFRNPTEPGIAAYNSRWFPSSEALEEPCNGRSTPWCASSAACLALTLYSHWLREYDLPVHTCLNLLSLELFSPPTPEPAPCPPPSPSSNPPSSPAEFLLTPTPS